MLLIADSRLRRPPKGYCLDLYFSVSSSAWIEMVHAVMPTPGESLPYTSPLAFHDSYLQYLTEIDGPRDVGPLMEQASDWA